MADRSVKVVVRADINPLKSAMADGGKSIDGLAGKTSKLGDKIKKGLSFGALAGGVLSFGAAIKGTFSLGLDFTTQMNTLQAVTGATGDQMAKVGDLARALGNDISIPGASASDAAEAMTELAKGGLSVQDAMDAAKGTLQLAAAAQVSGAQAATIQANALNTFGLKASDAGHVADVLANTANAASGEITDFAQGMQQAGSVAKLFGISLDDTSTVLGLFANNGIKGSDAGTSFKTMLTQLATPSAKAKQAMDALNLTVYDANGQFVGMRSLADQLAQAQGRMSQAAFQSAAGIVFGSDAIRGASILASGGVTAFDNMRAAVEKTGGAADLAGAKMKGLPGALQNLQNAAENAALGLYQTLAPAVEGLVNGLSHLLGWIVDLPGPIKAFGAAMAALAVAKATGLLGGLSNVLARIKQDMAFATYTAPAGQELGRLGAAATVAKTKIGAFVKSIGPSAGIAAGIGLISAIVDGFNHVNQSVQDTTSAAEDLGKQLAENNGLWDDSIQKAYEQKVVSSDIFQALVNDGADYGETLAVLTGQQGLYANGVQDVQKHLGALSIDQSVALAGLLNLKDATKQQAASQAEYTKRQEAAAKATEASTAATAKQAATLDGDMRPAQDRYLASLIASRDAALSSEGALDAMSGRVRATATKFAFAHDTAFKFADSIDGVKAAMDRMAGKAPDVEEATRRFNGALTQAIESAKDANGNIIQLGNGIIKASGQIDTGTKKGQDLYDTVTDLAGAARDNALAMAKQAGATGGVTAAADAAGKSLDASRQKFIDNAKQLGLTREQAKKLADAYFGLPSEIKVQVYGVSDFTDATNDAHRLADKTIYVNVRGKYVGTDNLPTFNFTAANNFRASGGWIRGPGTPTSDSIPARLSNGEFVVNARAAAAHGPLLEAINRSGLPGFAEGGRVGAPMVNPGGPRFVIPQSSQPVVRQVTYQIYQLPGESTDQLVQKLERRIMFHSPVMAG